MIHALANIVAIVVLSIAVWTIFYTVGLHFEDIVNAILGRFVR